MSLNTDFDCSKFPFLPSLHFTFAIWLVVVQTINRRLEKKIEREKIMIDTLPALSVQILELAKDHGRITLSEIVKLTNANRNTVKKRLQSLTQANHLTQHGTGKGTWYLRS